MKRLVNCGPVAGVVVAVFLLVGCQPAPPPAPGAPREQVELLIHYGPGVKPVHQFVDITGRPTVLQVTRQVVPVDTETTATGEEWVVGIGRHMADGNHRRLWAYELNNEAPTTAPNLRHVAPGDVIFWRLQ